MPCRPLYCTYGNCIIQQRYILAFMCFFAILNNYNTRVCFHLAITEITEPPPTAQSFDSPGTCPGNISQITIQGGTYNWTEMEQGILLLSFFPGYLIMHLPGGIISDRYGGRHMLSSGVFISGILTLLTPLTIQNFSWEWLAGLRFILGIAQASMYPAIAVLLARWVPARQRSNLGSLVYTGELLGVVSGTFFTGLLIQYFGNWPIVFYVWGLSCILWYVISVFTVFSGPDSHPFITEEEKNMLVAEFGQRYGYKTPWKGILNDSSVWALILAQCGHDWITYLVQVDIPKYFKNVLKLSVATNGLVTAMPWAFMSFVSVFSGWLSDYCINKHGVAVVKMRIIYTTIASVGPSVLSLLATYMGCNKALVIGCFVVGLVLMGPYYSGLKLNNLDLSLNFCGLLMSLANGLGVITGIVAPYIVADMASDQTMEQWQGVFWVTFVICTVTNVIYIIWAAGERRPWDLNAEIVGNRNE